MHFEYNTVNTCSKRIEFDIEGNVITNVSFLGGCNGNLKAVSKLVDGMTVEQIEAKLKRDNIQGDGKAKETHYEVGQEVRNTINRLGGVMPEDLPTPKKSLKELEKEKKTQIKIEL